MASTRIVMNLSKTMPTARLASSTPAKRAKIVPTTEPEPEPTQRHSSLAIAMKDDSYIVDNAMISVQDIKEAEKLFDYDNLHLAAMHGHPRDKQIVFNDHHHLYFVKWQDDDDNYVCGKTLSVSGIVHMFFPVFDAEFVSGKTHRKHFFNETSKYYGKTPEEIRQGWKDKGEAARDLGTLMHERIEHNINGVPFSDEALATKEIQQYIVFEKQHISPRLVPYRTEWRLFTDLSLFITGTLDAIYALKEQPDDCESLLLELGDWKRSVEIKRANNFQRGKNGLEHLQDTNFEHYRLALLLYKYMIEEYYINVQYNGKVYKRCKVVASWLGVFHPDRTVGELVDFSLDNTDLQTMLTHRRADVANQ